MLNCSKRPGGCVIGPAIQYTPGDQPESIVEHPETVSNLRARMAREQHRTGPPEGFPALPPLPPGRYTADEFFALEK